MSETVGESRGDVPDRIEDEIYISVEAELVWELVSRPGWWINDGEVDDHPVLQVDGDTTVLTHPEWGDFAVLTVASERPRHLSFRWNSAPSAEVDLDTSTLVELWIDPKPGGVTLRVVESGFAALTDDTDAWQAQREQNVEGWANELRAARSFVTAHRG